MEFLPNAVIGFPWASYAVKKSRSATITFYNFLSELAEAIQFDKSELKARISESIASGSYPVMYTGQSMYGVDKSTVSNRKTAPGRTQAKQNSFTAPERLCWNCKSPDHTLAKCTHPKNLEQIAARKVEFYMNKYPGDEAKALKRTLFGMCTERAGPTEVLFQDVYDPSADGDEPQGNRSKSNNDDLVETLYQRLVISRQDITKHPGSQDFPPGAL